VPPHLARLPSLLGEMRFQILEGGLGLVVERRRVLDRHARRDRITGIDLAALALGARGLR
jgi:hypothetical protein